MRLCAKSYLLALLCVVLGAVVGCDADLIPDDKDPPPGAPCVSRCGNTCGGGDGCGGSCICTDGESCNPNGVCVALSCTDTCASTQTECGEVCGVECGPCAGSGSICVEGKCFCRPECAPGSCGDNGCGTACACAAGEVCNSSQQCVSQAQCTDTCDGRSCGTVCGRLCGDNAGNCPSGFGCDRERGVCACEPSCNNKTCGADGCGGFCGALQGDCAENQACNGAGQCVASHLCADQCGARQCGEVCDRPCGGGDGSCAVGSACSAVGACVCTPQCTGRECGADGCGRECGGCGGLDLCSSAGQCVSQASCTETCGTRQCGEVCGHDCGGNGGDCEAGERCLANGSCECVPRCDGKSCGPDGCGGQCGTCVAGQQCNGAGQCAAACVGSCGDKQCGTVCGESCGICSPDQRCNNATQMCECAPQCADKACGPNGCGGSCGDCPDDQVCNPAGQCASVCLATCDSLSAECGEVCAEDCGNCDRGFSCQANRCIATSVLTSCDGCPLKLTVLDVQRAPAGGTITRVRVGVDYSPAVGVTRAALADFRIAASLPLVATEARLGNAAVTAQKELYNDPTSRSPWKQRGDGSYQFLVYSLDNVNAVGSGRIMEVTFSNGSPGPIRLHLVRRVQTLAPLAADTAVQSSTYDAEVVVLP